MTLFKLNLIEVIVILVPVIVVFWRFFHVAFEAIGMDNRLDDKLAKKMQKDFKKIEKELRLYGSSDWNDDPDLIIDTPKSHVRLNKTICLSCRKANDHVPPLKAEFYKEERSEQYRVCVFVLDKNVTCEHCGFMYSTAEGVTRNGATLQSFAKDAWTRYEPKKDRGGLVDKKQTTTKEIMDDYNKEAKKLDLPFKLLMFAAIWFAAALIVYGLSFVPWLPILISFWILTKVLTYELTRWYSLIGLSVALFIFCQWHKQAIKDRIDYIQNIRRSRKRYRGMVERKAEVTEDELKSFVNEVNHIQERERITEKYDGLLKEIDEATISEEEIPF